jgi:REP element-mobilizing transposase RayT
LLPPAHGAVDGENSNLREAFKAMMEREFATNAFFQEAREPRVKSKRTDNRSGDGPRRRRSIRLEDWDYSSPAAYFVTICAKDQSCHFGEVADDRMRLSPLGEIVTESWEWLARQYPHVSLDAYVIMPNHMHGVIVLHPVGRGGSRTAPTIRRKPLGQLIGALKTRATKRFNRLHAAPGTIIWQRGYYDHIIRDDEDLRRIRRYISLNPLKWSLDPYHPKD